MNVQPAHGFRMTPLKFRWPTDEIEALCRRWKIARLELFGSAVRDDFRPDSDIDLLVTYEPDDPWGLFDFMDMREEISEIVGRKVELVEREAVKENPNRFIRKAILESARVVYESR